MSECHHLIGYKTYFIITDLRDSEFQMMGFDFLCMLCLTNPSSSDTPVHQPLVQVVCKLCSWCVSCAAGV